MNQLIYSWATLMAIALAIALIASLPPKRPVRNWLGDFFVRFGLSGLMLWFLTTAVWALREVMNMRLILPFSPLEAYLEYLTWWGAALTGMLTITLFGTTLFLQAIFSRPEVIITQQVVQSEPSTTPQRQDVSNKYISVVVDNRRVWYKKN